MSRAFLLALMLASMAPAAEVRLTWNANSDTNITKYKLYQGGQPGVYTNRYPVAGTSYTVPNLSTGVFYFFTVTAVNSNKLESDFSSELQTEAFDYPPLVTNIIVTTTFYGSDSLSNWNPIATFSVTNLWNPANGTFFKSETTITVTNQ